MYANDLSHLETETYLAKWLMDYILLSQNTQRECNQSV